MWLWGGRPAINIIWQENVEDLTGGFYKPDVPLARTQSRGPTHMQGPQVSGPWLATHLWEQDNLVVISATRTGTLTEI